MMILVDVLLWSILVVLAIVAATRSRVLLHETAREGALDFLRLLPRLAIGVIGAGFIAEVLPQDVVGRWLGPESGLLGVAIAVIAGAITPGGPVVGFSIAAAALKGGAGAPQVIAFVTAWSLYAVQRMIMWELPVVPTRLVWLRALASLPLPFIAAIGAILLARP
jgi:uncharacterized membrane protein YraQ (UPF0718 family)